MKKYILLAMVLISKLFGITTSGEITGDETWYGTVIITGDVIVTTGTLNIEPGTVVKFKENNDNVVYGNSYSVCLAAKEGTKIIAKGTEADRIRFVYDFSVIPFPGGWGGVRLMKSNAEFEHCIFEWGTYGIIIDNPDSLTGKTSLAINRSRFNYMTESAISCTDSATIKIDSCIIHDCDGIGVFADGVKDISITYSYLYRVSAGIVFCGRPGLYTNASIRYITVYNIDMMMTNSPKWWTGYGIFCVSGPGTLNVSNSIVSKATLLAAKKNDWVLQEDYNCWNTGGLCIECLLDFTPGANSIEKDPKFLNENTPDLRLGDTSPCKSTGIAGTNMGAWQTGDSWPPFGITSISDYNYTPKGIKTVNNLPSIIFDMNGKAVQKGHVSTGLYFTVDKEGRLNKRHLIVK